MTEASKKFMTMSIWSAAIVLIIRCLIGWTELSELKVAGEIFKLTYTFIGYIGEAIAISALFMWVFNKLPFRKSVPDVISAFHKR